jgi:hypothetical protein
MPPGFTPERDSAYWSRASGLLTPRLALPMPGQVYRKLGTSVETQLMVFDKVQEDGEMIRVPVRDLEEALAYVDAVASTRTEMRPYNRQRRSLTGGRPFHPLLRARPPLRLSPPPNPGPMPLSR